MSTVSYSPQEIKKVKSIQFSILSPEDIIQMSVAEIVHPESFEKGKPKIGGVLDPAMGTCDRDLKCTTCNGNMSECPGHFGHITLAKPMFHHSFLGTVVKVLQCICIQCSCLLVDKKSKEFQALRNLRPKTRLAKLVDLCKGETKCLTGEGEDEMEVEDQEEKIKKSGGFGGCGSLKPHIKKGLVSDGGFSVHYEYKTNQVTEGEERKGKLSPEKIYQLFKKIKDEDLVALGFDPNFSRPEWMIITVLPVPPPAVRPPVSFGTSGTSQDDLTYKLADIIKTNSSLEKQLKSGTSPHQIQESLDLLQYHIATYFDNEIAGLPRANHSGGKDLKTIRQRLKGKEGRVRGNLMGKRVDFSARTVITADPNLSIDQVGVPRSIALNLTFPEVVTPFNMAKMQELIRNGAHEHPGAKFIIKEDGARFNIATAKRPEDITLEVGCIVVRHIQDGDVVLFNRQPSLHKMSMMGHHIKVMPYSTFRLNLSVTTPYNADFDGDEMNLHVPQSLHTKAELLNLMMVSKNIISPQANKPVIGIVQDTLLGCSKLTRRGVFIEKDLMMNVLMWIREFDGKIPQPAILKPQPMWTGKQLFSTILPFVNLTRTSNTHEDDDADPDMDSNDSRVLIDKGELLCGVCDSKTLGRAQGGLIHIIMNEHGNEVARNFIDRCQQIVNNWLLSFGFSVGIGDTIADNDTMKQIEETIKMAQTKVKQIIKSTQEGNLQLEPGRTLVQSFEYQVNNVLNKARDDAGSSAQKSLKESNRIKAMVTAGSKGSYINISQIIACVGQQNVEGKRVPFGFKNRTLPHFTQDDHGPESRGFVANSYLRGLTAQEFFFHAMGGREGLIDTAVKTSETGYIQRRLMKAMEDVVIRYDGTVRDAKGSIIQFIYGEDGLDAVHLETIKFDIIDLNDEDLKRRYQHEGRDANYILPEFLDEFKNPKSKSKLAEELEQIKQDREVVREISRTILKPGETSFAQPVNIDRLIRNAQKAFGINSKSVSDINPLDVIDQVKKCISKLIVIKGDDKLSDEAQKNATILFHILVRSILASKRVLKEYKLNKRAFESILGDIESKFLKSLISPGESVGAVAAQSIGEPATQMTLNTFHYAGVSSKNVTLGVPRLKELINVAKNIKTPSLTVYLNDSIRFDQSKAKNINFALEYTTIGRITSSTSIYFDPDPMNSVIEQDVDFVTEFYEMPDHNIPMEKLSPWVLRLEIDAKSKGTDLLMSQIAETITKELRDEEFHAIPSYDNAEKLVIQLRHVAKLKEDDEEKNLRYLYEIEDLVLNKITLRGVKGIQKVFLQQEKKSQEWFLSTEGINLQQVLAVPVVDPRRTISNSITEVLEVLGIEACRASLLKEVRNVLEFDGQAINYRHLSILCDVMTHKGFLMAITRFGVERAEAGPIMRASFEKTVEILMEAGVFAEMDELKGVSSNIMMGQLAAMGTGCFDVLLDEDMCKNAIALQLEVFEENRNYGFGKSPGGMTPYHDSPGFGRSPSVVGTPYDQSGQFSPLAPSPIGDEGGYSPYSRTPFHPSPMYSPGVTSPKYSPTSPQYEGQETRYSPKVEYSPTSPKYDYGGTSPKYSPTSPMGYSPQSPKYSPVDKYGVTSPKYSPSSPKFDYSPTSPKYDYSPTSPKYDYSPTSPKYDYSPTSPKYDYSPSSPSFGPQSPSYHEDKDKKKK